MTFVEKALLQKQLVTTIGASTLVNAFMFVMNVERHSRLKLHSVFTKRIICTYFPFSCPILSQTVQKERWFASSYDFLYRRATMCIGSVSESRVNFKTQDFTLREEALCLPRMWPQFWSKEVPE